MIKSETEEDVKLSLKKLIESELNRAKRFINLIESNLEHENEEIQKKTALIAIAFIKAVNSTDMEETREVYQQFKKDKKNGH